MKIGEELLAIIGFGITNITSMSNKLTTEGSKMSNKMSNKTKKQYIKHIGSAYLNGRCAVKHAVGDLVQVSIQDNRCKTLASETMTKAEYDRLEEKWTADYYSGDARIVQNALKYFGMWAEGGDEEDEYM